MAGQSQSTSLQQTQGLQQRLNPQQVLLGRYLEMSAAELEESIRNALDENPALVEASAEPESTAAGSDDSFDETADQLQAADFSNEEETPFYRPDSSRALSDAVSSEPVVTSDENMIAKLERQLGMRSLSDTDRLIADYIIGSLDSNGYLTRGYRELADDISVSMGMDISAAEVRRVADVVRGLDPPGIGAIDLRDCLLLQLRRMAPSAVQQAAVDIVADNFDLFSKMHFSRLRSRLGIDDELFRRAMDLIRSLNPKPGSLLEGSGTFDRSQAITPDFSVTIDSDNRLHVSLLNSHPDLAIDETFDISRIPEPADTDTPRSRQAYTFLKSRHDDAAAFIRTLRMRSETLMKVMKAIAAWQHRFFISEDPADLRPMRLADIQQLTGLDPSVISRATSGKYVMTRQAVLPLKTFFNVPRKDTETLTSVKIMQVLKQFIEKEDKKHPLSDRSLADLLEREGFPTARRTVAKYREEMGIPVARLRKQQ